MVTSRLTLIAFLSLGQVIEAAEAFLEALKDNTLYESPTGTLSNGAGAAVFVGQTNNGDLRRALLAFDVASALPAGAVVTGVRLTLHMSKTISGAQSVSLHRLGADWGEGTSDASAQEGTGAAATPNDATWLHMRFDTSFWIQPGGDFAATPSATLAVGGVGFYTWDSTPELVANVTAWFANPASNFGWIIIGEEGERASAKRFDARENATQVNRPQLTIEFSSPVVPFERGDTNGDGSVNIANAVCALDYLFGAPGSACKTGVAQCLDAADANDSGSVDIADAITLLSHLFAASGPLPAPFGACGDDPTADANSCGAYAACGR